MLGNDFLGWMSHQQEIEDFINELAATDDPNDESNQLRASYRTGIHLNRLTNDEIAYIEKEVAKRWR
jgi:hypothetical protein